VLNQLPKEWQAWADAWEPALECWSRFTRLHPPAWCMSAADASLHGMPSRIFAMIRLVDHEVVISLEEIEKSGVKAFAKEILAHEIGHHVYCPADLTDNARLLARIRANLPSVEQTAPMVSNLYADLLINDRLQRLGLDMAGVYRKLRASGGQLWTLYMRSYEVLWSLSRQTLAADEITESLDLDAQLAARVIRAYASDWVRGAGRFAALALPYVLKDAGELTAALWMDLQKSGEGGTPEGLSEIEEDELDTIHPAFDPEITGIDDGSERVGKPSRMNGRNLNGGRKSADRYRGPLQYSELMKALGSGLSDEEIASKYYRERAMPHLIRFPMPPAPMSTEPTPEGLAVWDMGSPLSRIDWLESVIRSPTVVPGITTVTRTFGDAPVLRRKAQPIDLYIGIDCSGSMPNPRQQLSYPVLAGTIMALSALRAGALVQVVLSGEPGSSLSTDGFVSTEQQVLAVLTNYLGTGYAFGIGRLRETFNQPRKPPKRKVHVLLITDHDIFSMLNNTHKPELGAHKNKTQEDLRTGWRIAEDALKYAGGGGTCVLHMSQTSHKDEVSELEACGWAVHRLNDWPELTRFAREFSKEKFERRPERGVGRRQSNGKRT
jgi:hypothetical protein